MSDNCLWYVQLPITQPPRYITYPGVMQNRYVITDFGQIFDVFKGCEVVQFINKGYYKCNLKKVDENPYQYSIHRLVAWEWVLKNRDFNLHINHKDGNKLNNNYWNLEWVTPAENTQHAWRTGLIKPHQWPDEYPYHINQGETHGMSKLTDEEVHMACRMLQDPKVTYDEVLDALGHKISRQTLIQIATGLRWTHISRLYKIPLRSRVGENHPNSILTDQDVHQICYMLQNPWISYDQIAAKLNGKCKVGTIIGIAHGDTWTHISRHYKIPFRQWEHPTGVDVWNSKLTEDDVRNICKMLEDPKYTYKEIIELLGLQDKASVSVVHRIANGSTYSDISSQYNIAPRENDRVKIARISSKLDEEKVHQICQMLQDPTMMYKDIGVKFGVSDHTILDIAKGHIWQDVSSQYEIPDRSSKNHAVSKLNASQVYQICEMLRDPYITYRSIANELGVSASCIQGIANGYNWLEISSQFNIPQRIRKKTSNPNYKN